jgi:hypothetical protein
MHAWRRFWFEADGRAQFRAFRPVFGLILLAAYSVRSRSLGFLYSDHGIASRAAIDEIFSFRPCFYLHGLFAGPGAIWAADLALLGALGWMAVARRGRVSALIAYALHLMFVHRNLAVIYGVDFVASFYLFFVCLADDRPDPRPEGGDFRSQLGSVAFRLAQIQLCVIYGFAGVKKLKGLHWWSGEALWDALANPLMARWDFFWLASHPLLIAGLTYAVLAWEVYFPALVWCRRLRGPILAYGALLHLLIALSLNIPFFSAAMVATYVFFSDPAWLARLLEAWDRFSLRGTARGTLRPKARPQLQ